MKYSHDLELQLAHRSKNERPAAIIIALSEGLHRSFREKLIYALGKGFVTRWIRTPNVSKLFGREGRDAGEGNLLVSGE